MSASPVLGPSEPSWRRERLLRIGSSTTIQIVAEQTPIDTLNSSENSPTEHTTLHPIDRASYGTMPSPRRRLFNRPSLDIPHRVVSLPSSNSLRNGKTTSSPTSPTPSSALRDMPFSRLSLQRPIPAYDAPLHHEDDIQTETDARVNGIRVWYSSFSSVDWLHDAIQDSVRFARLRRRASLRARVRLIIDKSLGWFIVTIVGVFTALLAFLIVRSELWLFDIKDGYCRIAWWKAKRFCCTTFAGNYLYMLEDRCPDWRTWADVFSQTKGHVSEDVVEYISYALIAVTLAFASSLLTIYLTDSTTFTTRKESGVFAPIFDNNSKDQTMHIAAKRKVMYYAAGSGIPEIKTILSGIVIHGYLGGRTLFTKCTGLALAVASGLSLGKEGPFVHIASCVGNIVSRFFSKYENNEAKRREILSAACAAGVAVAFGAPIGGTLFSLEEVSYFFPPKVMWRSFFCAMIAAITLKILDPFGTGKLVLFQVTYEKDWHAYELLPFLGLGVFGGVYGAYFSKLNHSWSKYVRNGTWLKSHPIVEVVLITMLTTALCFLNTYTHMGGTELVYTLFSECRKGSGNGNSTLCVLDPSTFQNIWPVIRAIIVTMFIKAGLTVVTFGIKLPAGIFIPSLGVGACAGRVLGIVMRWLQYQIPESRLFQACKGDLDCIIPGLYAMVGAAAALSGVTRTTVSLAVIMFELTDTLTYAVPVMLSVLVAKTVADTLEPKGIYDLVIELNQLPYLDAKHEYLWGNLQINDVTSRDVEVIRLDKKNTVKSLRDQLFILTASGNDDSGFPILRTDVNEHGFRMVGYIGANELEHALSIVADEADDEIRFQANYSHDILRASMSTSSLLEDESRHAEDLYDFSVYMDQAPLTVQSNSPLEMIHQFFVKLGARYVVVIDTEGLYEGVIDKKTWLAFLADLEEKF